EDGVDDRRGRADRARFAAAFDTERVVRAGRPGGELDVESRQIVGARQGVIGEAAREELSVLVVATPFEQRLPDALSDAAVYLTFDDHWIDDVAEIVAGAEPVHPHRARLRIDLHFTHVRARRVGEVGRIVEGV